MIAICRVSSSGHAPLFVPSGSSLKDVGPRSSGEDGMTFVAKRSRCRNLLARSRQQPIAPVEPPASLALLGRRHERIWTGWVDRPDHEGCLLIGWRIEKTLEVAAV